MSDTVSIVLCGLFLPRNLPGAVLRPAIPCPKVFPFSPAPLPGSAKGCNPHEEIVLSAASRTFSQTLNTLHGKHPVFSIFCSRSSLAISVPESAVDCRGCGETGRIPPSGDKHLEVVFAEKVEVIVRSPSAARVTSGAAACLQTRAAGGPATGSRER